MKKSFRRIILSFAACVCAFGAQAQVYQWCVKMPGILADETNDNPEAWLWLPDTCTRVNAIMFSQQNMTEETIFNSPRFREQMSKLGVGIVWVAPGIDQQWDVRKGTQQVFDRMISDLSTASGYDLNHVPVIPIGHSAMATFPWNFAAWNPERTLAVISYHGDAPRTNLCGYGRENLEWGRTRNIDGIPGLMIEGEHEWWEARVNPAISFRIMYPGSCVSFLCDAGHGHFDASPQVIDYMGMFIAKALRYRTQADGKLKKLDPADGWLAKRWNANDTKRPKPAPYASYKGDRHDAFWYFDAEMANATEATYRRSLGKKQQYIGYCLNGRLLNYDKSVHAGTIVNAPLGKDGLTFSLSATFTDSLRSTPSKAHSRNKIVISPINGPVKQLNDTTFQVSFYHTGFANKRRTYDLWFQALADDDASYRGAAQQILLRIPHGITDGKPQSITFPTLTDMTENAPTQTLKATSTSGLSVHYYVKQGPAVIVGDKLRLTPIPPLAKKPVKVVVVAWQYGVPGQWNSAAEVTREFYCFN